MNTSLVTSNLPVREENRKAVMRLNNSVVHTKPDLRWLNKLYNMDSMENQLTVSDAEEAKPKETEIKKAEPVRTSGTVNNFFFSLFNINFGPKRERPFVFTVKPHPILWWIEWLVADKFTTQRNELEMSVIYRTEALLSGRRPGKLSIGRSYFTEEELHHLKPALPTADYYAQEDY